MKILLIAPWGLHDVLTQSYVLPYIPYLTAALKRLGQQPILHLITFERELPSGLNQVLSFDNHPIIAEHWPFCVRTSTPREQVKTLRSFVGFCCRSYSERYDFTHSWCSTGGALGYLLSILLRCPLVLDSFEPHADPMFECGCWTNQGFKYRFLRVLERLQAQRASAFFPVSKYMFQYSILNYGVAIENRSSIKPACVKAFPVCSQSSVHPRSNDSIAGIYVGKFGGLYLGVEFFRILSVARELWGDLFSFQILSCQPLDTIKLFADQAGCSLDWINIDCVPHSKVMSYLQASDFGILALKQVPSRLCCTPIKTGEYWSAGLPILSLPGISTDSETIVSENIGVLLDGFDYDSIQQGLKKIASLVMLRKSNPEFTSHIRHIAQRERGFHIASNAYLDVYSKILIK